MSKNTKVRSAALAALAAKILADSGADVRKQVAIRPLAKLMQAQCDACYDTCKRHIARAVRRARGEYVVRQWGGYRPGGGRPPKLIESV